MMHIRELIRVQAQYAPHKYISTSVSSNIDKKNNRVLQCEKQRAADNDSVSGGGDCGGGNHGDGGNGKYCNKQKWHLDLFIIVVMFKYHALTAATINKYKYLHILIFL